MRRTRTEQRAYRLDLLRAADGIDHDERVVRERLNQPCKLLGDPRTVGGTVERIALSLLSTARRPTGTQTPCQELPRAE